MTHIHHTGTHIPQLVWCVQWMRASMLHFPFVRLGWICVFFFFFASRLSVRSLCVMLTENRLPNRNYFRSAKIKATHCHDTIYFACVFHKGTHRSKNYIIEKKKNRIKTKILTRKKVAFFRSIFCTLLSFCCNSCTERFWCLASHYIIIGTAFNPFQIETSFE